MKRGSHIRGLLPYLLVIIFILPWTGIAQDEELVDDRSDSEVIIDLFSQTLVKMSLLLTQTEFEGLTILVCETFSLPFFYGRPLDRENPTYENFRDYAINNMMPNNSRNGEELESIFDKEMMRDVDQVIKYSEASMDFGLQLIMADGPVKVYLAPERNMDDEWTQANIEDDEEEYLYNGMTQEEYQERVLQMMDDLENMEFTGNEEEDAEMMSEIINGYFNDEDDSEDITYLVEELATLEYTGDPAVDEAMVNEVMERHFREIAENEEGETLAENFGNNEPWDNGIYPIMEGLQLGDRNVENRYGEAASPFMEEYREEVNGGNAFATNALTNFFGIWNEIQQGRYIERMIEVEGTIREFYGNGGQFNINRVEYPTWTPPIFGNN